MSEHPSKRTAGAVTSVEEPAQLAPGAIGFTDRRDAGRRSSSSHDDTTDMKTSDATRQSRWERRGVMG